MKKLLLSTITIFSVSILVAQNQHLSFKGIPIDGTLNDYVLKMKTAGFRHIETIDGIASLKGDFAGYKDCSIYVQTLKPQNLVSEIVVSFPSRNQWYEVCSDYKKLKEMLITKYGIPKKVKEEFSGHPSDPEKLNQIGDYKGFYYSIFELSNGRLTLIVEDELFGYGHVNLWYTDRINSDKVNAAAINDL